MVKIPPIKLGMNGGWFMTLLYQYQHYDVWLQLMKSFEMFKQCCRALQQDFCRVVVVCFAIAVWRRIMSGHWAVQRHMYITCDFWGWTDSGREHLRYCSGSCQNKLSHFKFRRSGNKISWLMTQFSPLLAHLQRVTVVISSCATIVKTAANLGVKQWSNW